MLGLTMGQPEAVSDAHTYREGILVNITSRYKY